MTLETEKRHRGWSRRVGNHSGSPPCRKRAGRSSSVWIAPPCWRRKEWSRRCSNARDESTRPGRYQPSGDVTHGDKRY